MSLKNKTPLLYGQMLSAFAFVALTTACTPQGRPVADGIVLPEAKTHTSTIGREEYQTAMKQADEDKTLVESLLAPFKALGFKGQLKMTITRPESDSKVAPAETPAATSDSTPVVMGECQVIVKESKSLLVVSVKEYELPPVLSRSLVFEVPVDMKSDSMVSIPSLISYSEPEYIQLKTLTKQSSANITVEAIEKSDSVKIAGIIRIIGQSSDEATSVRVEGDFSCTVDPTKAIDISQNVAQTGVSK